MATRKVNGSYHGFKVQAEIDDEGGVKIVSFQDGEGVTPKGTKLEGKSFTNARQAGRAAFDTITDFEKLPRLPDARFMAFKAGDGKTVSARKPADKKPAKTSGKKSAAAEPDELTSSNGVRKSNPKANAQKNGKAAASRKPSAVTSKRAEATPKSKSASKRSAAKVSSDTEDLDI